MVVQSWTGETFRKIASMLSLHISPPSGTPPVISSSIPADQNGIRRLRVLSPPPSAIIAVPRHEALALIHLETL